jgi:putative transcriptional regulator
MSLRDEPDPDLVDLLDPVDLADLVPVEPSPEVKARLLASTGGGRFAAFAPPIATMFEVTVDRAHELLGLIERSASWKRQLPGIEVIRFSGGPGVAGADCAFVRIAPGATFPMHAHVGREVAIVLAGRVHDATEDRVFDAGGSWELAAGTRHALVGQGEEPCVCAVCAHDGVVFARASD